MNASMSAHTRLLAGEYLCAVTAPAEYEFLQDPVKASEVNEWLGKIGCRLARLHDAGSFYIAHLVITSEHTQAFKDECLNLRDRDGPAIRFINLIRTCTDDFTFQRGTLVSLADLETSVNGNTSREAELRGFHSFIHDGGARFTNRQLLKKMLDQLVREQYLILLNPITETYQFTGLVDVLASKNALLAEHNRIAPTASDDAPEQTDLIDVPGTPQ